MNCKKCPIRKYYAKAFDIHFDKLDCPYECIYEKKGINMNKTYESSKIKAMRTDTAQEAMYDVIIHCIPQCVSEDAYLKREAGEQK